MADYSPLYLPGKVVTVTVSAVVTGGKCLKVSGDGTVAHAAAAGDVIVGVAGQDAAASGDKIPAFLRGTVHRLIASGTVTAGDLVNAGAAGTVATLAAVTTPTAADVTNSRSAFGIALTTATTGNAVEIMEL